MADSLRAETADAFLPQTDSQWRQSFTAADHSHDVFRADTLRENEIKR